MHNSRFCLFFFCFIFLGFFGVGEGGGGGGGGGITIASLCISEHIVRFTAV